MIDALVQFDTVLFFLINGMHHPITDTLFIVLTQLGNGWVITPLLLFVVLLKIPPQKRVKIIVYGAIGLILCGVVNSQIKRLVGRKRPAAVFSYRRPHDVTVVDRKTSQIIHLVGPAYQSRSFPSGHTNTAFSAALFLAILFGRWFYLTFIAAFLVGYSRIYLGVHFPLDVVGGALLGSGMIGAFMRIAAIIDKQFLLGVVHDKR